MKVDLQRCESTGKKAALLVWLSVFNSKINQKENLIMLKPNCGAKYFSGVGMVLLLGGFAISSSASEFSGGYVGAGVGVG